LDAYPLRTCIFGSLEEGSETIVEVLKETNLDRECPWFQKRLPVGIGQVPIVDVEREGSGCMQLLHVNSNLVKKEKCTHGSGPILYTDKERLCFQMKHGLFVTFSYQNQAESVEVSSQLGT